MKFIFLIFAMLSIESFATTETNCRLVDGIYHNSDAKLEDLKFETLVDVFTLRNAHKLTFTLDGNKLRFTKVHMTFDRHTKMTYVQDSAQARNVFVTIDRTPRKVVLTHEFFGNILISRPLSKAQRNESIIGRETLNYNFYCSF